MRSLESLTEREVLALAISQEEEDARIYDDFADGLKDNHPEQAEKFDIMRADEDSAVFQVVLGGMLVFLAGVLIGSS